MKRMRGLQMLMLAMITMFSMTSCYQFNREQREKDAQSNGKATLMEAEYSKQAKIEESKANYESAKLEAQTIEVMANAKAKEREIESISKAKAIKTVGDAIKENPDYVKFLAIDGMYNHGNTIFVPTENGTPLIMNHK